MTDIKIVGTNHLMSKEEIYSIIKKERPNVIGVELCETRYNLMVLPLINKEEQKVKEDKKDKPKEDKTLVGKISNAIKEKAEEENVQYGSDQINACLYAVENKIPLEFVDLDITKTKELMDKIPKKEQEGFMQEMLEFQKKTLKEVTENIDVDKTLRELKEKFPIAFEFLINLRNLFILNKILKLERKYPYGKILIFLGKGHEKMIEDGLK